MAKVIPPPDPRPRLFERVSADEYLELCARDKSGEFVIAEVKIGPTPARYTVRVFYTKPYKHQLDLL